MSVRFFTSLICNCRYDPKTDQWTMVAPISSPRDAVGVCLLGDRLYAVGGYDGQQYIKDVESYDPVSNEWSKVWRTVLMKRLSEIMVVICVLKATKNMFVREKKVFGMGSSHKSSVLVRMLQTLQQNTECDNGLQCLHTLVQNMIRIKKNSQDTPKSENEIFKLIKKNNSTCQIRVNVVLVCMPFENQKSTFRCILKS